MNLWKLNCLSERALAKFNNKKFTTYDLHFLIYLLTFELLINCIICQCQFFFFFLGESKLFSEKPKKDLNSGELKYVEFVWINFSPGFFPSCFFFFFIYECPCFSSISPIKLVWYIAKKFFLSKKYIGW